MASLRDIRTRITGVTNTSKITSAMKMVSAAKLKRAQDATESARPYAIKMNKVLSNLVSAIGESYSHELISQSEDIKSIALIIIGSDKGLCGSFNNAMFKFIKNLITKDLAVKHPNAKFSIVTVGKKPTQHFKRLDYNTVSKFPDIFTKLKFETAIDIVDSVKTGFIEGKYDKVYTVYNRFVNVITSVPTIHQLLPIEANSIDSNSEKKSKIATDYIFEPNQKLIMDELLPKLLNISIWSFLLESNAAEQASRMMAMDAATNNANELLDSLKIVYNRERQAAITTEMLEIVGGANALEN